MKRRKEVFWQLVIVSALLAVVLYSSYLLLERNVELEWMKTLAVSFGSLSVGLFGGWLYLKKAIADQEKENKLISEYK